ncbi:Helicase [Dactylella cylindrospora]|nr:Helicase [Dactylella cylindrospora]
MSFESITTANRIEYLANYSSASLGRVKKLHLGWAIPARGGPLSPQCQELNRLHSLCVDGNRIKVPQRLEDLPKISQADADSFILEVLHREAVALSKITSSTKPSLSPLDSVDFVERVLCEPRACSEVDMVQLLLRWCRSTRKAQLSYFLPYINLDALTEEQRQWLAQEFPPTFSLTSHLMNSLTRSEILSTNELSPYHLDYPAMRWKCIYSSYETRLGNLLEALEKSFSHFHRKLLVIRVTDRFSIAIYIPKQIPFEEETALGPSARILAFTHTNSDCSRIIAPGADYRLFFDHSRFEIYNRRRQDTFIFVNRAQNDNESYRAVKGAANRGRERQKTIESGRNHDFVTSIALAKFSSQVRAQMGQVRREGILAAELYVISNSDVASFRVLDLWLESIDTLETKPLFEKAPLLHIPRLEGVDFSVHPPEVKQLFKGNLKMLEEDTVRSRLAQILQTCYTCHETRLPSQIYQYYLDSVSTQDPKLVEILVDSLYMSPGNVVYLTRLCPWPNSLKGVIKSKIDLLIDASLQSLNRIGLLSVEPFKAILQEVPISNTLFRELVEKICLLVRDSDLIFSLYFDCLEPLNDKLSRVTAEYFSKNLFGIALDHFDEANERKKGKSELWKLDNLVEEGGAKLLKCERRLDAPQMDRLATGDHVRFYLASKPENVILSQRPSFDAFVEFAETGSVTFRCLSHPPSVPPEARWYLQHCGSFVTSKAMLDALTDLVEKKEEACPLYPLLFGQGASSTAMMGEVFNDESLNASQSLAVDTSIRHALICIWGPPGTGKTHTIVVLLHQLLERFPQTRILVTAPTHNAVDNVLRKFLRVNSNTTPIRVSTNVRKVASDLVRYTCDAWVGKELSQNFKARREAMERLQNARLVFTTCAGAGLGLLRDLSFPIVIIDEASQQAEPMSLIPLVKGCEKAILVGDHVQLRATVRKHAKAADFEISLFERLYTSSLPNIQKVMLNVQYRMHPEICKFPSYEFYEGKLFSADSCQERPLPKSSFPWPEDSRCVFIPCAVPEDFGRRSKGNEGQAYICKAVWRLLTAGAPASIAILTPYSRQVTILKTLLPSSVTISSIDGFQGQEADIIIYVTVRSNLHGEIGFLEDMRRLNVALTRAKAGLIIIGNELTLKSTVVSTTLVDRNDAVIEEGEKPMSFAVDPASKAIWQRLLKMLTIVEIPVDIAITNSLK